MSMDDYGSTTTVRTRCDESCHDANLGTCDKCDTGDWDLLCDTCRFYAGQDAVGEVCS